jgi:fructokinase
VITVLGETLVDHFQLADREPSERPGGSPANVAVALARLGVTTRLITQLGLDEHGRMLLRYLRENNVTVAAGSVRDDYVTSVARTVVKDGQASYDFDVRWEAVPLRARLNLVDGRMACLHTGSIGALVEPGAASVLQAVLDSRSRATITFDPNCRPSIMGHPLPTRQRTEALVAVSDVVKASEDDIRWLYEDRAPRDVVARWLDLGAALVVVTRGAQGSWATTRGISVDVRAHPIDVVDTVGAGDSFMAGLLAGLGDTGLLGSPQRTALAQLDADALSELLRAAGRVAAITCGRRGANSPTAGELALDPSRRSRAGDRAPTGKH